MNRTTIVVFGPPGLVGKMELVANQRGGWPRLISIGDDSEGKERNILHLSPRQPTHPKGYRIVVVEYSDKGEKKFDFNAYGAPNIIDKVSTDEPGKNHQILIAEESTIPFNNHKVFRYDVTIEKIGAED